MDDTSYMVLESLLMQDRFFPEPTDMYGAGDPTLSLHDPDGDDLESDLFGLGFCERMCKSKGYNRSKNKDGYKQCLSSCRSNKSGVKAETFMIPQASEDGSFNSNTESKSSQQLEAEQIEMQKQIMNESQLASTSNKRKSLVFIMIAIVIIAIIAFVVFKLRKNKS